MFCLCKTVVDSDFYTGILCSHLGIYLVQSASISMYSIHRGMFEHVGRMRFFDVIRSVEIVGDRILVVFNGYLVVLDSMLSSKCGPSAQGHGEYWIQPGMGDVSLQVGKYRFGRSSMDSRNVGAYVRHVGRSIGLVSFFGQMLFYTVGAGLSEPVEHTTDGTVLDFRGADELGVYLSLERTCERTVLRSYEHTSGLVVVRGEVDVPGGYMVIPLGNTCVVFSTGRVFLVKDFRDVETYESPGVGDTMFTCSCSHTSSRYSLTLVLDETGELFRVIVRDGLELQRVDKISPSKDIKIHPGGFLITIGYNSDNHMYHLKEAEDGGIGLELTDTLDVLGISRSSGLVYDGVYHVYLSNLSSIKEVVRRESLRPLYRLALPRGSEEVSGVFESGGFLCVAYGGVVYNLSVEGNRLVKRYEIEFEDKVVGYFRLEDLDVYLMDNSVRIVEECDSGMGRRYEGRHDQMRIVGLGEERFLLVRRCRVCYDIFSGHGHEVLLGCRNRITRITSVCMETIEVGFGIRGLGSTGRYLFLLTGARVLRVYSMETRRHVFIQSFRTDVRFVTVCDGYVYAVGERIHRLKINDDGSLSLSRQMRNEGEVSEVRGECVVLGESIVSLRTGKTIQVGKNKGIVAGERVAIVDGSEVGMYEYRDSDGFGARTLVCGGEYVIVGREAVYIENGTGFRIRRLDGGIVAEGEGRAIDFSSSEYQVVSVCKRGCAEDPMCGEHYLQIYRDGVFLYEFKVGAMTGATAADGRRVYFGCGNVLYSYEVGKKTLLRKSRVDLPSRIVRICVGDSTVAVGTERDSVCIVQGDRHLFGEQVPRQITALERMGRKRLVAGDRSGNVLVMEETGESLVTRASMFVNDMPVQFITGERVFVICLSGKVCEIVEVGEDLFRIFEDIEWEIGDSLGRPFFSMFGRNRFVDAEHLKLFYELDTEQVRRVCERTKTSMERMFDIIGLL